MHRKCLQKLNLIQKQGKIQMRIQKNKVGSANESCAVSLSLTINYLLSSSTYQLCLCQGAEQCQQTMPIS